MESFDSDQTTPGYSDPYLEYLAKMKNDFDYYGVSDDGISDDEGGFLLYHKRIPPKMSIREVMIKIGLDHRDYEVEAQRVKENAINAQRGKENVFNAQRGKEKMGKQ